MLVTNGLWASPSTEGMVSLTWAYQKTHTHAERLDSSLKKEETKSVKKKKSKPSLFQAAGEESHSLLAPALESSKHCFIFFVRTVFFWISSCCLSISSWIWMSTACSSLVTESSSSVRAIGVGQGGYKMSGQN